jgi:hypothetical protein
VPTTSMRNQPKEGSRNDYRAGIDTVTEHIVSKHDGSWNAACECHDINLHMRCTRQAALRSAEVGSGPSRGLARVRSIV